MGNYEAAWGKNGTTQLLKVQSFEYQIDSLTDIIHLAGKMLLSYTNAMDKSPPALKYCFTTVEYLPMKRRKCLREPRFIMREPNDWLTEEDLIRIIGEKTMVATVASWGGKEQ
jgi:hypothetical protein